MESVSSFKMNTVTENFWLIYAAATVIWPYHVGYYFQSLSSSKTSTPIPCPVDHDDTAPLNCDYIFLSEIGSSLCCGVFNGESFVEILDNDNKVTDFNEALWKGYLVKQIFVDTCVDTYLSGQWNPQ